MEVLIVPYSERQKSRRHPAPATFANQRTTADGQIEQKLTDCPAMRGGVCAGEFAAVRMRYSGWRCVNQTFPFARAPPLPPVSLAAMQWLLGSINNRAGSTFGDDNDRAAVVTATLLVKTQFLNVQASFQTLTAPAWPVARYC